MQKRCSEIIFGCEVCSDSLKCLTCNADALAVNKFKTKRGDPYLFCTNEINYTLQTPDGKDVTD